jgi:large subunit ribosomal protein L18
MPSYGSRYRVPLRRRREQKTDYQARKAFIVSHKPRLVARSSLKNTIAQIVVAKPSGDFVLASAHSKELVNKYGWKAATGNVPAAYLTGLLCGLKAKKTNISEAILDLGLISPTKGSKVFSTMSGVVDAGVVIPHNPEKIIKERTRGFHIQDYAEGLGAPEGYAPKFSTSVAKGLDIAKFGDHFFAVREAILTAYGMPVPKPEAKPVKVKKPEPKKVEPKPTKVEKAEVKPEAKPVKVAAVKAVEAKKPAAEARPVKAEVAEVKAEVVEVEAEPEAKPKAKSSAKAKPAAKKAAPAKAKAVKAEKAEEKAEAEPEAKPAKKAAPKGKKSETEAKPAKKSGGKKQ